MKSRKINHGQTPASCLPAAATTKALSAHEGDQVRKKSNKERAQK